MKKRVKIIAQYHPAAALHQPRLWAVMLDDWAHMPQKVDADYIVRQWDKSAPKDSLVSMDTENDVTGDLGAWSIAWRNTSGELNISGFHGRVLGLDWGNNLVVMHNAKWDIRVLKASRLPVPSKVADTMIAAYVLGYGRQETTDFAKDQPADSMVGGLGLKYLARRHLGMSMKTWNEIKDKPDEVPEYNANDSVATYLLFEKWRTELPEHFWTIDMPLLPVCMSMEDRGIKVDPDFLKRYAETLDGQLVDTKGELNGINPYSPKQVQDYIYNTLGVEPTKWTDSKQPSTDRTILETIDDPIVKRILEYRDLYKERKTYVSSYANRMDAENRIHPEFKQTSTATGRLSCSRPNLQNVTIRKESSDLRKLFVPDDGKVFVDMDFNQLELRVFAGITGEERMIEAFNKYDKTHADEDKIHSQTADFLGIKYSEAKNINFLMLYGGGAWKISNTYGVPIDRAKAIIAKYYKMYPAIEKYHANMIAKAHEHREVINWFGRRRRLDSMYSENWRVIKEGEREAINTPVQGAAADIVKITMIDLHHNYDAPMLVQVHDELIFEILEADAMSYAEWLYEHTPALTEINGVKFPVDVGIGKNWAEAKKEKVFG